MNFLYKLYDAEDALLYVGITTDPTKRFAEHSRSKPWWSDVVRFDLNTYASWEETTTKEAEQIASLSPRYNLHPGVQAKPSGIKAKTPASYQPLPEEELAFLRSLGDDEQAIINRAKELYDFGWSVRSILGGVRITPPSTWIVGQLWKANGPTGRPIPPFPPTKTQQKLEERRLEEAYRMRPQLSSTEVRDLQNIHASAVKYRPQYGTGHYTYKAKEEFTDLIRLLKDRGVRTQEIADAVGVNESNIRRRLKGA